MTSSLYKLVFFVPPVDAARVKEAVFSAGAGKYRAYDRCSWETEGVGQFRPLEGSRPQIGSHGVLERVPELRVEMICPGESIRRALTALIEAHPYEEPAYDVTPIYTFDSLPEEIV